MSILRAAVNPISILDRKYIPITSFVNQTVCTCAFRLVGGGNDSVGTPAGPALKGRQGHGRPYVSLWIASFPGHFLRGEEKSLVQSVSTSPPKWNTLIVVFPTESRMIADWSLSRRFTKHESESNDKLVCFSGYIPLPHT